MQLDYPFQFLNEYSLRMPRLPAPLCRLILLALTIITCSLIVLWHIIIPFLLLENRDLQQKPNIVLIVGDDIGWNDIGYAKNRKSHRDQVPSPSTPNMDKLAAEGVKFESNYVLPTCTPSRAALHTGRYPHRYGVSGIIEMNKPVGIDLEQRFLPRYLKDLGYDCHLVGKWHLGYCKWQFTPTERGYDSFFGFHGGAEYYYTHRNIVREKGKVYDGYDYWLNKNVYRSRTYSTFEFGNRTIDLIRKSAVTRKPFFINLSFQAAHAPLEVPDAYLAQYEKLNVPQNRKRFMAIMTAMDEEIGRIVSALKQTGQWSNTVFIFTSDNGGKPSRGGSNFPLRGTKTTLWEGGTRVPAFIVGKNIPKGSVYNGFFHITDWLPTVLSMAGDQPHKLYQLDGIDHWKNIKENLRSPRREFVYLMYGETERMAIRRDHWKLIVGNPGRHNKWYKPNQVEDDEMWTRDPMEMHLFNIEEDPKETINLTSRFPDTVKRLYKRLMEYKGGMGEPVVGEAVPEADPDRTGGVWMPGWC